MKPAQSRAARGLLSMTQTDLAKAAGLGQSTVIDFEKERRVVSDAAVTAMRFALEEAGVDFIQENGGGAGVRLKRR
ncbi:helix-turn-helix domain-containing protein [Sulfitobacter guttiformis]|uniref:Helix-turn-helix protein n=1 Tax=Sulfitobacter guttiformis TaxID=74349 RepID=A0A420DNV9_9RHOB|nr:helix-turn-helix transcriptional regulator [Sulfitobacter guttiformis]RKE95941.1 helix-turn-helix protein [Sulfitobacter guttiformis]